MIWQDIIIFIASLLFSYALVPQVYQGFKKRKGDIHLQTALINSIGMYIVAICFIRLALNFSGILGISTATLWAILAYQRMKYK